MIREIPTAAPASVAVSPAADARRVRVTAASVGALSPLGRPPALGCAQRAERAVHLVLAAGLTGGGAELGVPVETVPEGGEGEGLQDVLDDAEGDALADDREVAGGGDGDDVGGVPGGTQGPYEMKAVSVGQIEVQQQQIDRGPLQQPHGFGPRVRDPGNVETGDATDTEGVCVGGDGVVLDDENSDGGVAHLATSAVRCARTRIVALRGAFVMCAPHSCAGGGVR